MKEQFRQARLAELGDVSRREPNPEFDWMRQAAAGSRMEVPTRSRTLAIPTPHLEPAWLVFPRAKLPTA
mgnify:CR=1 FL=1